MILVTLLLLPLIHYIADFELQNNWMALGKSKRLLPLTVHVLVYSLCFALLFGWQFGLITFVCHWGTDYLTSRWTSKLWFIDLCPRPEVDVPPQRYDNYGAYPFFAHIKESRHRFFCVIGLDQMIHWYCLLLTALTLNPNPLWWLR